MENRRNSGGNLIAIVTMFALYGMVGFVTNLAAPIGKYTEKASGLFMTMVVGGGFLPLLQAKVAGSCGYMVSYLVPGLCLAYMLCYALFFSKNVNTDIKTD